MTATAIITMTGVMVCLRHQTLDLLNAGQHPPNGAAVVGGSARDTAALWPLLLPPFAAERNIPSSAMCGKSARVGVARPAGGREDAARERGPRLWVLCLPRNVRFPCDRCIELVSSSCLRARPSVVRASDC